MIGFGSLQSPKDLLAKLQHDYRLLSDAPGNTYIAYNFFVTAEHMLDWLYPGDRGSGGEKSRTGKRQSEILLRIVSHIANGAKHFHPNPKRHHSVTHVDHSDAPYGHGKYGDGRYGADDLIVTLEGEAAAKFGVVISALTLAEHVLLYWQSHPPLA